MTTAPSIIRRFALDIAAEYRSTDHDDLVAEATGAAFEHLLTRRYDDPLHEMRALRRVCKAACRRWLREVSGAITMPRVRKGRKLRPTDLSPTKRLGRAPDVSHVGRSPSYWAAVERLVTAVEIAAETHHTSALIVPLVEAMLDGASLPAACREVAGRLGCDWRTLRSRFASFAATLSLDDADVATFHAVR